MKSKITSLMPFSEDEELWVVKQGEVTSQGHVSDERQPNSLLKVLKKDQVYQVPLQDCFDLQKSALWQQGDFEIEVKKDNNRFVFVNRGPMISWQMGPKWYDNQRIFRNDTLPTEWLPTDLSLAEQLGLIFAFCQGQRPHVLEEAEQDKITEEASAEPTKHDKIPQVFEDKALPTPEPQAPLVLTQDPPRVPAQETPQKMTLPPLSEQASGLPEFPPAPESSPLEEAPFEDDLPEPEIDTEALGRIKNLNHVAQPLETRNTVVIGGKSYQAKIKKEHAPSRFETVQKSRTQTPDGVQQKVQRSRADEDDQKIQALANSLGKTPEAQPGGCGKVIANIIWLIVIVWFLRIIFGF